MKAEELIIALAQDVPPVAPNWLGRRLVAGLMLGGGGTLALVGMGLGVRPDLMIAMHGPAFWIKGIYTASLGVGALAVTARLARPDPGRMGRAWMLALPMLGLATIGLGQMIMAPRAQWLSMWLGHSARICSALVVLLAVPIFGGLLWSFRWLAPTRLRAAGAMAGLCAGAWSATLYCLHCPEVSAIFVLAWYTLGIVVAAGLGALVGPRLLRW